MSPNANDGSLNWSPGTTAVLRPEPGVALRRIDPRFRPVWERCSPRNQTALSRFFLPARSTRPLLQPTRPRILKWYCPFAPQTVFPSGHRYCINVYTGCAHDCRYCYAVSYEPSCAGPKKDFARLLGQDLDDLERFDVPAAPVHLSNSTDPFQPLEARLRHARTALEGLLEHRHRFTTIVLLTKNPSLAAQAEYSALLRALGTLPVDHPRRDVWQANRCPPLQVEVSLAFWRDEARLFWDPGAPPVAARVEGIRALRAAGIPVVLRIDPLLPRSPLRENPPLAMRDLGLAEAHTLEDLDRLVRFAREVEARHVVYSTAKIVRPRFRPTDRAMAGLRTAYETLSSPGPLLFRGGSWRLPTDVAARVTEPFLTICRRHGVAAKFCRTNLLETP